MEPLPAAPPVFPNPRIPRTLGILNIVFASGLLLCGLCMGAYFALMVPAFGVAMDQMQQKVRAADEDEKKSTIETLIAEEKTAKTDEEKLEVRAKRKAVEARPPAVVPAEMDLNRLGLTDPKMVAFFWIDYPSGVLLNILLLVSGIGLLRFRPWGVRLGLGVAAVKIVRLVLLYGYSALVLVPEMSIRMAKMANQVILQQQKAGGPPPPPAMYEMLARTYSIMGLISTVGVMLIGVIYPIILLWLLTRPAVRAACSNESLKPAEGGPR